MKKLMTLMLGLSLVIGTTALFGQDTKDEKKTEKKGKKGKKKKTDDTDKKS
jgi:hypothetical protein